MEKNKDDAFDLELDRLNAFSEELIRKSYLDGMCRSVWVLGLDDGMN